MFYNERKLLMITRRYLMTTLLALPLLTSNVALAQEIAPNALIVGVGACPSFQVGTAGIIPTAALGPGIFEALTGPNGNAYDTLLKRLWPNVAMLTARAGNTNSQPTYQNLLSLANSIATAAGGRLVVTVPDGAVLVDTSRNDGPGAPNNNLYQNFLNKTINENHNSRTAIFSAQLFPCGIGVETKKSTTTGQDEHYVAVRLGTHLHNEGTARLSVVAP
jgi:hypothetical protein